MKRFSTKSLKYEKSNASSLPSTLATITSSAASIDTVIQECPENAFTQISVQDQERWYNQPDQAKMLEDNNGNLYFDMKPYFKIEVDPYADPTQMNWYNADQPIFKHGFNCDKTVVTLRYKESSTVDVVVGNSQLVTVPEYIMGTDSLIIFKNGMRVASSGFDEISSTQIRFFEIIQPSDVINIQYGTATLVENTHFYSVNTNIIKFESTYIFETFDVHEMQVWGYRAYKEALNPLRLIDKKAKVTIKDIQQWHPIYGYHFVEPYKNIELELSADPAYYTTSTNGNNESNGFQPWTSERVGTTWLDTSDLQYKRYHDTKAYNNCEDRIRQWGQLADFAECKVYEWVESDVLPDQWNDLAESQEGDLTIEESLRKSGTVWFPMFVTDGDGNKTPFVKKYEMFDASLDAEIDDDGNFVFTTTFINEELYSLNVYLNGNVVLEDIFIPSDNKITVPHTTEADIVYFVQIPTTDETYLDDLISDGTIVQEYQYSEGKIFNVIGEEVPVYYFWVRDKKTVPNIPDRSMSAFFAERELVNSDVPYCFFQNPMPPSTVLIDETETIDVPWRMTQFVVRGLRGLVDADRRYVLQFTRDFTLRDSLEHSLYETKEQEFNQPEETNIEEPETIDSRTAETRDAETRSGLTFMEDSFTDYNGIYLGSHMSDNGEFWNSTSNVPINTSPLLGNWPQIKNNGVYPLEDYECWAWYYSVTDDVELQATIRTPNPIWDETEVSFPLRWDGALDANNKPIGNGVSFGLRFTVYGAEEILYQSSGETSIGNFTSFEQGNNLRVIVRLVGNYLDYTIRNLATGYQEKTTVLVSTSTTNKGAGFLLKGNDTVVPGVDDALITSASLPAPIVEDCFDDQFTAADGTYLYDHISNSGHLWNVETGDYQISKVQTGFGNTPTFDYGLNWASAGAASVEINNKNLSFEFYAITSELTGSNTFEIVFRRTTSNVKDLETSLDPRIIFSMTEGGAFMASLKVNGTTTPLMQSFTTFNESWTFSATLEDETIVWNLILDVENTQGTHQGFSGTHTNPDLDVDSGIITLFNADDLTGGIEIKSFKACDSAETSTGPGEVVATTCKSENAQPTNYLELKNKHESWKMLRQEQKFSIDKSIWDMITESMIGRKIDNPNIVVPSYERTIYDVQYETDTRIGIGDGQAFCDGDLAENTIISYLLDRENDLYPIDITVFFEEYSFETAESTITAMDAIYSTFPYTHVNRMFFEVLHDALSLKHEYPGIIKTSWLSLHSIIILDDQGKFDD